MVTEILTTEPNKEHLRQADIVTFNSERPYMIISRINSVGTLEYNMVNLELGKLANEIWYENIQMVVTEYFNISKVYRGDSAKLILK